MIATGACFGWVTPTLKHFLKPQSPVPMTHAESSWVVSMIEFGNLFSPIPVGILIDSWGRKPWILSTGPLYFISWIIIYYTKRVLVICVARFIQGLVMGIVFTAVPVYLGEISSPEIRGAITSIFQGAWYLGFLIEYCVGPYVSYDILIYITAVIPVISFVYFVFQPESPYYLILTQKYDEAAKSLAQLRGSTTELVKEELEKMIDNVQTEMEKKSSWTDIVKTSTDRRALLIVQVVGGVRTLSGMTAIFCYSTQLFAQVGNVPISPDVLTIIMGACMFISSFFNTAIIDIVGRRPILLVSTAGCAVSLFVVGVFFYLKKETSIDLVPYGWIPPTAIVSYCGILAFGLDPVSMTYRSEMFPANTRGIAASVNTINFTVGGFFTLKFYQVLEDSYGVYIIYFIFASICFFGNIWMYYIAVETKGKSLAEVQQDISDVVRKPVFPNCKDALPINSAQGTFKALTV